MTSERLKALVTVGAVAAMLTLAAIRILPAILR
jgi:hypothetical protein